MVQPTAKPPFDQRRSDDDWAHPPRDLVTRLVELMEDPVDPGSTVYDRGCHLALATAVWPDLVTVTSTSRPSCTKPVRTDPFAAATLSAPGRPSSAPARALASAAAWAAADRAAAPPTRATPYPTKAASTRATASSRLTEPLSRFARRCRARRAATSTWTG